MYPPSIIASAPLMVVSRERRMLTTMKVSAVMLWVMPPPIVPQRSAANRFPVQRWAIWRSRRLASFLRFSVRSHIPTMNRPSPAYDAREKLP